MASCGLLLTEWSDVASTFGTEEKRCKGATRNLLFIIIFFWVYWFRSDFGPKTLLGDSIEDSRICHVFLWLETFHYLTLSNHYSCQITCAKLTLVHFVPLVNVLKEAVPSNIPEGVPRNAIQFTIADPFVPRPDSNKQTRKLLWVTSDVHTTAESWTLRDSFSWLIDARTRTFPELENVRRNCTVVQ